MAQLVLQLADVCNFLAALTGCQWPLNVPNPILIKYAPVAANRSSSTRIMCDNESTATQIHAYILRLHVDRNA